MSLDTRNKRAGAIHIVTHAGCWPAPDGSLATVSDRRQMLRWYPFGDSVPVVVAPVVSRHVVSMQHTRSTQPAAFAQHTAHTTFTRQGSEP